MNELTDKRHRRRIPQDEIDSMTNMRKGGVTYAEIGKATGRSAPAAFGILNPKRRARYARTYYAKKKKAADDNTMAT